MQFMKQALQMIQRQNIQLKKQLKLTKNTLLNINNINSSSQSDSDHEKIILKNQLYLLREQYNQIIKEYENKKQKLEQQMSEMITQNQQYIDTLRAQLKNQRKRYEKFYDQNRTKDIQIQELNFKFISENQKMQQKNKNDIRKLQEKLSYEFDKKAERYQDQIRSMKSMIQSLKHTSLQERKHRIQLQQQLQAYHHMLYKQKDSFEQQLTTLQNINTTLNDNLLQKQDNHNKMRIELIQKTNECICQSQIIRQFKNTIKSLQMRNEKLQKSNKQLASKEKIISKKAIDSINASKKYLALHNQTAKKKQKLLLIDQKNLTKKIKELQNQSTSKIHLDNDSINSGKASLQNSLHQRNLSQSYTTVPNISLFLLEDLQQNKNNEVDMRKSTRTYQLKLEDIDEIDKVQQLETPCFDTSRNFEEQLKALNIREK